MNETANPLVALLSALVSGMGTQPGINVQAAVPAVRLPYGCTECIGDKIYFAKSVDDLTSWDNHVECGDGGTFEGLKVKFLSVKKINKSDKQFSTRDGYMARFEISRAGGKNPMNEVINIFVKQENDYKPYLNPAKWAVKVETIEFRSEEPDEEPRKFRLNMVHFMGELISDDVMRKARHIRKRVTGMYTLFIDGEEVDLD